MNHQPIHELYSADEVQCIHLDAIQREVESSSLSLAIKDRVFYHILRLRESFSTPPHPLTNKKRVQKCRRKSGQAT